MATQTQTIDSQVHAYERNHPGRPWNAFLEGPDEVTGDDMVAAMDAVGVDGALLRSTPPSPPWLPSTLGSFRIYIQGPTGYTLAKLINRPCDSNLSLPHN